MEVALLNAQVLFQRNTASVDAVGNRILSWEDYYSCHATLGGEGKNGEQDAAGQTTDHADAAFTVRYCDALKDVVSGKFRILYGDEIYNILSVDHRNNKRKSLKFFCKKVRR